MPRNVVVLGSTGSIGRQTLDIVRRFPERVAIWGLAANRSVEELANQAREVSPRAVVIGQDVPSLSLPDSIRVLRGDEGMSRLVQEPEVDLVIVGTAGKAGLLPTLAALDAGKLVALANKETLIMGGPIIKQKLAEGHGELVPIDSEHSAIWQCLQGEPERSVERLTLTASGGALRHLSQDELAAVTPAQALAHPTWRMGPKITVDSANLMNKGLEAIEARWLFDIPLERIGIVMHPQSIIHSLVTFDDSSTKAQLGLPDMRLPIQYALSHPDRWTNDLPRLDLAQAGSLTFSPVDASRYPAMSLALEAGRKGGTYPAALAAADEVAVEAFLAGTIPFTEIPGVLSATLDAHTHCPEPSLDAILESDTWARRFALGLISR